MKNRKFTKRFVILLLAMMLVAGLCSCTGKRVSALDYALESQIYSEQTGASANTEESGNPATTTEPAPEETPLPEETSASANQPENTEPVFLYTLCVSDQNGVPIPNARVTLYADGELLYSDMTNTDGKIAWTLSAGCVYTAKAELAGYAEKENNSRAADNKNDKIVSIILCEAEPDKPAVEQNAEPDKPAVEQNAEPEKTAYIPAPESDQVTITAEDVSVQAGEEGFSLLEGVSAVTAEGRAISVWVVDEGGFSISVPGKYTVLYAAMQKNSMISASRTVTVTGSQTGKTETKANVPSGSSEKRYKQLLAYRNEIYEELAPKMQELSGELESIIQKLIDGKQNIRLLKETLFPEDTETDQSTDDNRIEMMDYKEIEQAGVSNWPDILAVFIAKSSIEVEKPLDLLELRHISFDGLDEVFWDMVKITVLNTDNATDILLDFRIYDEMAEEYGLSQKRTDLLYELMQPEFQRIFASLTGNTAFDDMNSTDIQDSLSQLPEGLQLTREKVVSAAYSLVGKVTYFWAGKYNELGWNPGWGLPRVVTSAGSKTTGKTRPYGLDCSGFVSWVFINATGDTSVLDAIGNGSSNQWEKSVSIGWDEGKPGDLAFFSAPGKKDFNHVGIIVSVKEDGSYLVAHCSSSKNGVVVTDAWSTGFRYLRRPILYQEAEENES